MRRLVGNFGSVPMRLSVSDLSVIFLPLHVPFFWGYAKYTKELGDCSDSLEIW